MRKTTLGCIVALLLAHPIGASGQQPPKPAYSPGLGEFMLQTQIRHLKLWLAGNAGNWELADYQIDELKEGLEDAAKLVPTYKGMPTGAMIESTIMKPIAEVETAIKARDRGRFVTSFDALTEACNNCHAASNRAFIVVQRPSGVQFPNQSFAPKPR
jgi:hypothetical protein